VRFSLQSQQVVSFLWVARSIFALHRLEHRTVTAFVISFRRMRQMDFKIEASQVI